MAPYRVLYGINFGSVKKNPWVLIKDPYKRVPYRTFRGSIYEASDRTLSGYICNLLSKNV
jgi:hypothetical protein